MPRRPRTYTNRELLNAIFYHVRAGGSWRCLPHDYPPWESVYAYFRAWQHDGTWQTVHDALRDQLRGDEGRAHEPTAAILDSQSVKTTSRGGERGYDVPQKRFSIHGSAQTGRHFRCDIFSIHPMRLAKLLINTSL